MGSSESTRTCPKCGMELLESNMMIHSRECSKVKAAGKPDGSWECTYSGPTSGIKDMTTAISAASREALEYRK